MGNNSTFHEQFSSGPPLRSRKILVSMSESNYFGRCHSSFISQASFNGTFSTMYYKSNIFTVNVGNQTSQSQCSLEFFNNAQCAKIFNVALFLGKGHFLTPLPPTRENFISTHLYHFSSSDSRFSVINS